MKFRLALTDCLESLKAKLVILLLLQPDYPNEKKNRRMMVGWILPVKTIDSAGTRGHVGLLIALAWITFLPQLHFKQKSRQRVEVEKKEDRITWIDAAAPPETSCGTEWARDKERDRQRENIMLVLSTRADLVNKHPAPKVCSLY